MIGMAALDLLMAVAPAELPRSEAVALGPEAVLFAGAASVLIGLVLGLATALPFTRSPNGEVLLASGTLSSLLAAASPPWAAFTRVHPGGPRGVG